ncbi:MAG: acetyl-CoA hydrolase/transferase family protein [Chloroflexi bacterium CFX7]|nr:acetyl-CoA hydrolase/transferase family protein [Chloroflexi bacterium CFX7]
MAGQPWWARPPSRCNPEVSWRERLGDRVITVDQAAALVKDGDRVAVGLPEPAPFLNALAQRPGLAGVTVMSGVAAAGGLRCARAGIRVVTMFASPVTRGAIAAGEIDFVPLSFHAGAGFVERFAPTVAAVAVAEPQADGTVRPGAAMAFDDAMVRRARANGGITIAVVVESQPQVPGEAFHVDNFDYFVALPTPEGAAPAIIRDTSVHIERFARLLDEFIPDGATLQAGVGGVPDEALGLLKHKRDLGIHTEVLGPGLSSLVTAGVANGSRKSLYPGLAVCTIVGPAALDFANGNEAVRILNARECLDPRVIAQNRDLRCVNSAVEVDLAGQVNAEMVQGTQFSGVGGQLDFFRACRLGEDSLSILAIESTAAEGRVSRIVPWIPERHVVTSSRYDVDVVVTEHGVAWLRDRSTRERARGLIEVAAPEHRARLVEEAGRLGLL